MKFLAIIALLFAVASAEHYAVLVAGSNGFYNYRHQADVCHAYQLLLSKGYSADNVIVMSYDDVASSSENPFPNTLYNKPTTGAGIDVNKGCVIDYKGSDVTPDNYVAIITGGSTSGGNGRVLKSGSDDHVFLAFFDHGGSGLIAFPSEYLYAKDLQAAFDSMHSKNMYSQLVYYMEACESGSMFQSLSTPNVYALSASNPTESSWGTYCSPDDKVDGTSIGSCLGDLFSVNWMENSDASDITAETLEAQWKAVAKLTDKSSVMQWGDLSYTSEAVSEFIGGSSAKNFLGNFRSLEETSANNGSHVDGRDIMVHYLTNKFNNNPSEENQAQLNYELSKIQFFNDKFTQIQETFGLTGQIAITTDYDCYKSVVNRFESQCGKLNENALKHLKYFYQLCQNEIELESTFAKIDQICA